VAFPRKTFFFTLIIFLILISFFGCSSNNHEKADISNKPDLEPPKEEPSQQEYSSSKNDTPEEETGQLPEENTLPEDTREEEYSKFFVPPAAAQAEPNPKIKAKGIYVTGNSAGLETRFQDFMDMIEATELNAMVIDVKNDHGVMTYPSEIEIVKEVMGQHFEPVRDIKKLLRRLEAKNIYPIARIVVFRDPRLPQFYPEWAIQKKDGGIWVDHRGFAWTNPYEKKVWDYNIAIAREAALMGFKEIQFDYVRFPENAENFDLQTSFANEGDAAKEEAINGFLIYAAEQLKDYDVHVSADIFGVIATYLTDKDDIGQNWEGVTPIVDYIYPMVYPSHYGPGFFGLSVPDANPRETILMALGDAIKRNAAVKSPARIRPWLQGFTATWIKSNISYTPAQIREQIDAALERGIEEYFVWNAGNQYDARCFLTEEEALIKQEQASAYRQEMGFDHLGKTDLATLEEYLGHISKKNWAQAYPYQATNFEMNIDQFFAWSGSWTFDQLEFIILDDKINSDNSYNVDIILKKKDESIVLKKETFVTSMENNIWKVKPSAEFIEALSASY
jgi:hypothetical protein